MNTVQLECFLAVAEHLNFARAAEALHITQPAVTHQIRSLESELGAELFHRTTRSVELTEEGYLFIGDARSILGISQAVRMRLRHRSEKETLPFILGCRTPGETRFLPTVLRRLMRAYPNLHPVLKNDPVSVMRSHLEDGSVDAVLGWKEKNAACRFSELARAEAALVVSPEHPLAERAQATFADIHEGCVILFDPRRNPQAMSALQHEAAGARPASQVYFCEDNECAMTLVKAGVGCTLLPDLPQLRDPALRYIPFEKKNPVSFGVYYKSLGQHPALKSFIEFAREAIAPGGNA